MAICYLGIGSNLGNREDNINKALKEISYLPSSELLDKATIYETAPEDALKQPKYLNTAVKISTRVQPEKLLYLLKNIERKIGRKKRKRWASRIIDIDILFYDNVVIDSKSLTIPHKLLHKRIFVLKPLNDIASELKHPVIKKTVKQLYENCEKS